MKLMFPTYQEWYAAAMHAAAQLPVCLNNKVWERAHLTIKT